MGLFRQLSVSCAALSLFLGGCQQRHFNGDADVNNVLLPTEGSPAVALAGLVKSKLSPLSPPQFIQILKHEYVKMHLLDRNGKWMIPELERISEHLIPSNLTMSYVGSMVDEMARNMEQNPYMMRFLNVARGTSFPTLKKHFIEEGDRVIPQAVAEAFAIEKVTQAELNDPKLVKALSYFWEAERERAGVSIKETGLFGLVKLLSVERPIRKIVEFHEGTPLDPQFLRGFLSFNIFEAIMADNVTGHRDNAAAGWPLRNNPAGDSVANPALGNGPAEFTPDHKKILIKYPLPQKWDDLYQVWNMAFVSQIGDYPTWIVKLLIPQMSGYQKHPTEYIYRRALSLYTALHYSSLGQIENRREGIPNINWFDKDLTDLWGKVNRENAEDYQRSVDRARGG